MEQTWVNKAFLLFLFGIAFGTFFTNQGGVEARTMNMVDEGSDAWAPLPPHPPHPPHFPPLPPKSPPSGHLHENDAQSPMMMSKPPVPTPAPSPHKSVLMHEGAGAPHIPVSSVPGPHAAVPGPHAAVPGPHASASRPCAGVPGPYAAVNERS